MGATRLSIPHVAHQRTLQNNLTKSFKAKYNYNNGNFGSPASTKNRATNVRHIQSNDPVQNSKDFMAGLVKGFKTREPIRDRNGEIKGHKFVMKDGGVVTWRLKSTSDGSPAVDINVSNISKGNTIN